EGADLLDVGGESLVTTTAPVSPEEETERVSPLIERVVSEAGRLARDEPGVFVSVDTYKPAVAQAATGAGAPIVNDPTGLIKPDVAAICAESGAALVITHTRARPKQKLHRPHYDDVVEDVKRFLAAKLEAARALGVSEDQVVLCPGPDLGKDPAQTV